MTRETKIGLLVGLAFIIVIGILLSDHMSSTTQPPQASLGDAAPNVLQSVTAPAPANGASPVVANSPPISPANQVPTQAELHTPPPTPAKPPVTRVEVGGPAAQPPAPIAIRHSGTAVIPAGQSGQTEVAIAPTPPTPADPTPDSTTALEQWAGQRGETAIPTGPTRTPAEPTKREYTAQSGDNLGRLASRMLGTNNKANRDAIVKANPSLQKNPDLIVEGRKYTIPQAAPAQAAPQPAAQPAVANGPEAIPDTVPVKPRGAVAITDLVDPLPTVTPTSDGGTWYVVKDNDNLWKIAADQLGSGNAWTQIKDLNKDVLKGGDTVQPNMRLRLPGKPLASAN